MVWHVTQEAHGVRSGTLPISGGRCDGIDALIRLVCTSDEGLGFHDIHIPESFTGQSLEDVHLLAQKDASQMVYAAVRDHQEVVVKTSPRIATEV